MEKKFSKPVLSQRVTVEPFIAFLLAWDLISKYEDLDRNLLSNSYIVLQLKRRKFAVYLSV